MNENVQKSSELILRRLTESFPFATPTSTSYPDLTRSQWSGCWYATIAVLLLFGVVSFVLTLRRRGTDKWHDPIARLLFGESPRNNTISAFHAGFWRAMFFILPAFCIALAREVEGPILWWILTIGMFVVASMLTVVSYLRDSQTSRWWSPLLALLRIGVYAVLAIAFLLPAYQNWEDSEKRSRVLILIDVSPSITNITDEISQDSSIKPATRLDKLLAKLTDSDIAMISKIIEKNPVYLYRFGSRLDDEPTPLDKDPNTKTFTAWTKEEWQSWVRYDFRPYVTQGLSEDGIQKLRETATWRGNEPGNADWAMAWVKAPEEETIPENLLPQDKNQVQTNRARLEKRIDTSRSLVMGTNVPDSLLNAINRESSNMVQGLIVFTDGRSNMGSDGSLATLADAAGKNKIPVFTVAVGEPRENISIAITDVQAPDRAAPDEPFKITVGADGVGLAGQEVQVRLRMYMPGNDPKKGGKPDYTFPDDLKTPPTAEKPKNNGRLTFAPGEPPSGQVEFEIDPDSLPPELLEEKKDKAPDPKDPKKDPPMPAPAPTGKGKRQMKTGPWTLVAAIDRHPKEVYPDKEHLSPPRTVQVIDRPMRILLVASGPTREYQTIRSLLAREMDEKRVELCVYMQNEGGVAGSIVQDVTPDRLLTRFPDRLDTTGRTDTPETKFYNLNAYDLLILFDPDWEEKGADSSLRIPEVAIKNIQNWVDNLGGGIIYVAGPIHTFQLARTEQGGRLQPMLDVLPVMPEDSVVVKTRGIPREPRRLRLKPSSDFDVLKLQEDRLDDPTAGWENYFTGRDKAQENELGYLKPKNGFYSFYPVKDRKPSATVLAEFLDIDEKAQAVPKPYLVVNQPVRGRTAWLGSGEIYRIRQTNLAFYDRFWIKLSRWVSANRDVRAARGRILVNKEFTAGNPVRISARILNTDGKVYPPDQDINTKVIVYQTKPNGEIVKTLAPVPLVAKRGGTWDGYYTAQIPATEVASGDFRYKAVISDFPDAGGDKFEADFLIRPSNPELDDTRPDYRRLQELASLVSTVSGSTAGKTVEYGEGKRNLDDVLKEGQQPGKEKLAFRINEKDKLKLIPECLDSKFVKSRNRGAVEDIWDRKVTPEHLKPYTEFVSAKPLKIVENSVLLFGLCLVAGGLILRFGPRPLLAFVFLAIGAIAFCRFPFHVGIVIFIAVTLLSLEWMIRKLLRLA